jgi:outer membrane protein OmpA-like peptidoglycan-associated protein
LNQIKPEAEEELKKITAFLKSHPQTRLKIEGFTDSKGSDTYNLLLSKRRAHSAANYLSAKGISKKRLEIKGQGEKYPLVPNENPDGTDNPVGRQQNRRVEFTLLKGQ